MAIWVYLPVFSLLQCPSKKGPCTGAPPLQTNAWQKVSFFLMPAFFADFCIVWTTPPLLSWVPVPLSEFTIDWPSVYYWRKSLPTSWSWKRGRLYSPSNVHFHKHTLLNTLPYSCKLLHIYIGVPLSLSNTALGPRDLPGFSSHPPLAVPDEALLWSFALTNLSHARSFFSDGTLFHSHAPWNLSDPLSPLSDGSVILLDATPFLSDDCPIHFDATYFLSDDDGNIFQINPTLSDVSRFYSDVLPALSDASRFHLYVLSSIYDVCSTLSNSLFSDLDVEPMP